VNSRESAEDFWSKVADFRQYVTEFRHFVCGKEGQAEEKEREKTSSDEW